MTEKPLRGIGSALLHEREMMNAEKTNKILRSKRCKAYAYEFPSFSFSSGVDVWTTQVAVSVETRNMPKRLSKHLCRQDYKSDQSYKKAKETQEKNRLKYNNDHMNKAIKALEGSVLIRRNVDARGFIELIVN